MAKKISFVVPVYRNAKAVSLTHQKLSDLFTSKLDRYGYEIVFVDDGSDDGSYEELVSLQARDPNVRIISFTRNFGQMAALTAGLREAKGDCVVTISADLQDPVELIEKMVFEWESGNEVVAAYRAGRQDKWTARLSSRIFYGIIRLSFPQMPKGGFDFLLMGRSALDQFNATEIRNRFFQGDILWYGFKTKFLPYVRLERKIGRSQYTLAKKIKNFTDAILDASYLPVRVISVLGVVTALFGILYALDIVYARFFGNVPFSGWAPIMVTLLFVSGVLMMMLGVIGEYVWRIYDEVRGKPNYVIRKKLP